MDRDFKGIWIPAAVWLDKRLTPIEKFYMAVYAQNKSAREADEEILKQASRGTLHKVKSHLIGLGLIKAPRTPEDAKEMTLELKGTGERCEWCGERSYILHEHHYPIPKSKGGTAVVRICPNCHYTYHSILLED